MAWSNWRLVSTQSTAVYGGAPAVVGGGRFNFRFSNGRGTNYNGTYSGAGVGAGVGLRTPASRIVTVIMDLYMPAVRALINSVGSQDIYLSNLYRTIPSELNQSNLNGTLWIIALGGEIGAGLSGSLLAWEDYYESTDISPLTARLGTMTPNRRSRINSLAVAVGGGVGLVGASATITVCTCNRFAAG